MDLQSAITGLRRYVGKELTPEEFNEIVGGWSDSLRLRQEAKAAEDKATERLRVRLAGIQSYQRPQVGEADIRRALLAGDRRGLNALLAAKGVPSAQVDEATFAEMRSRAVEEERLGQTKERLAEEELQERQLLAVGDDEDALARLAEGQGWTMEEALSRRTTAEERAAGRMRQPPTLEQNVLRDQVRAQLNLLNKLKTADVKDPKAIKAAEDEYARLLRRLDPSSVAGVLGGGGLTREERGAIRAQRRQAVADLKDPIIDILRTEDAGERERKVAALAMDGPALGKAISAKVAELGFENPQQLQEWARGLDVQRSPAPAPEGRSVGAVVGRAAAAGRAVGAAGRTARRAQRTARAAAEAAQGAASAAGEAVDAGLMRSFEAVDRGIEVAGKAAGRAARATSEAAQRAAQLPVELSASELQQLSSRQLDNVIDSAGVGRETKLRAAKILIERSGEARSSVWPSPIEIRDDSGLQPVGGRMTEEQRRAVLERLLRR
ncbi:MAG: hypothetical protein FJ125_02175 [Deltaproteobacteria bacterium]|nr:hypothetical protein [Deltaproteobacteria bacterium]